MKRLITISVFICISLVVGGCVYSKITVIRIKGDKVTAPFGSITPIEGQGVSGTVVRQVYWSNQEGTIPPPLSDINLKDETGNTGSADIKK